MALLTTQTIAQAGITPTLAAITVGGDTYTNDGNPWLRVKNNGAGALTVTITGVNPCNVGVIHDNAVSIAAGVEKLLGPFSSQFYANADNIVAVTYSGDTSSAQIGVFKAT